MKRLFKAALLTIAMIVGVVFVVQGMAQRAPAVAAAGLCLPFIVIALTAPISRRLAIRNASRRPKETLLILLGALLGTAIVTSASVVGDTFAASVQRTIYTQLGPVDEVIDVSSFDGDAQGLLSKVSSLNSPDIDGVMSLRMEAGAVSSGGASPRAEGNVSFIDMSFADAKSFGGDPKITGITGDSPKPGSVILSDDLARKLAVTAGQRMDLYYQGEKHQATVERTLPRLGLAGFNPSTDANSVSLIVFLPPGTLAEPPANADESAAESNVQQLILVSNRGGVTEGARLSDAVGIQLNKLIPGVEQGVEQKVSTVDGPSLATDLFVQPVKQQRISDGKVAGKVFSRILTGIGSFTIIAGILLLINIFTMLAQERQGELGMLRAIGMKRRSMVSTFSFEGFLYGIGSSALGVLVGVGVGWIVVFTASAIFSSIDDDFDLIFDARLNSLAWGFLSGLGITVLTVLLASLFIARMNVIRAIRELPDPGIHRRRVLGLLIGLLLLVIGVITTASGLSSKNEFASLSGPAVGVFGFVMVFRRWVQTKLLLTIGSIGMLAWSTFAFTLAKKAFNNPNPAVYVVQGVQLTAFAVALVSANQERIGGLLRRLGGGRWSMSLRLGLAYPLARRGRTGLLLAMFSLVMFVLTFIITIGHVLTTSVERQVIAQSRGADIEVGPTDRYSGGNSRLVSTIPIDKLKTHPQVNQVAAINEDFGDITLVNTTRAEGIDFVAADDGIIGNGSPELSSRESRFASDEAALRAVFGSDDLVIVRNEVLRERGAKVGLRPGDRVTISVYATSNDDLATPTPSSREFTVAAVSTAGPAVMMSRAGGIALAPDRFTKPSRALVQVRPGVDATTLASELSGLYVGDNVDAVAIRAEIKKAFSTARQFLLLVQGYLALGLFVGIAGLGVVMVRAVRERRRQIAMLRAMGFPSKSVRHAFLSESAFIAGEGILIGVALALIVLSRLFASLPSDFGVSLEVPWVQLSILIGATFLASLAATAVPAQKAARIEPAVALRTVD